MKKSPCFIGLFFFVISILGIHSSLTAEEKPAATAEEEVEILDDLGVFLPREGGGQINLRIVDGVFRLYSVDDSKKVQTPDFEYALVNYLSWVKRSDKDRTIKLTPDAEGQFLTASRRIQPPYHYRVRISLRGKVGGAASDSYSYNKKPVADKENLGQTRLNQLGSRATAKSDEAEKEPY